MLSASEIIERLGLVAHPREGGYFRETYRSKWMLPAEVLPSEYAGARCASTAIYYLLTPSTFSEMHCVTTDEIFHFYLGDAVEMLQLRPDGRGEVLRIGNDLAASARPQAIVPGGVWQGARLAAGGKLALMGTTVAPGFEFADYRSGIRAELIAAFPDFAEIIAALTHR